MNLVLLSKDSIPIGSPLPFSLRDKSGGLLAAKGHVVISRHEIEQALSDRGNFFIEATESEAHSLAFAGKLIGMLQEDVSLGQIAQSHFSSLQAREENFVNERVHEPDWMGLQESANTMLKDQSSASFLKRLNDIQGKITGYAKSNPDGALLALTHLASNELRMYSATHGMLVAVMCNIASREILRWPKEMEDSLCKAALTMNLSMTGLQDKLSQQMGPLDQAQKNQIAHHALRSVVLLEEMGVTDNLWLEAILEHHGKSPGALANKNPGSQMARLIQRADIFAACLAPRAARFPANPAMAMKSCYFDENGAIDEAGAALVKTMGIYSPGSLVRLATGEIAMVVKRGINTTMPKVAVIINRSGMPTGDYISRDTRIRDFKIVSSVARRDIKVNINLDRMLALSRKAKSDFSW